MTRPNAFAGANYSANFNGEAPDQSSWRTASVPQDKEWRDAFSAAVPGSIPTLIAWKGYVPSINFPFYYMADDGVWRDTVTGREWVRP